MSKSRVSMAVVGVLAGFPLVMVGCASTSQTSGQGAGGRGAGDLHDTRTGLELRRWVIRGSRGQAARSLGVLADLSTLDVPGEADRWEHSGVRAAVVSAEDVEVLRDYLSVGQSSGPAPGDRGPDKAGAVDPEAKTDHLGVLVQEQVEWLGLLPEWVPIYAGPEHDTTVAMIDSGPLQVDPGSVSMLSRAWVMPGLEGGRLHVELVPQVPVKDAQGTVFVSGAPLLRQHLGTSLEPGEALLVFPAGSWRQEDTEGIGGAGRAETSSTRPVLDQVVGPPAPTMPTLGELMLVADEPQEDRVIEQVLVFVAHLPESEGSFEVIERTDEPLALPEPPVPESAVPESAVPESAVPEEAVSESGSSAPVSAAESADGSALSPEPGTSQPGVEVDPDPGSEPESASKPASGSSTKPPAENGSASP